MNRSFKLFGVLVTIGAALAVWWLTADRDAPMAEQEDAIVVDSLHEPSPPGRDRASETPGPDPSNATESHDEPGCLSPALFESHPAFADEAARLDSVGTGGQAIASYRGLSQVDLEALAVQGDSAAMAALGAIALMNAKNLGVDAAIPYLLSEDKQAFAVEIEQPLQPGVAEHLQEANHWFYQSALHGRVMALSQLGQVMIALNGGTADLQWFSSAEYADMQPRDRSAIHPMNVYSALPYHIAPNLRTGILGELSKMIPSSDLQETILDGLARQFEEDREAAGLPPIAVAESMVPTMEEFRSMVCESQLETYLEYYDDD